MVGLAWAVNTRSLPLGTFMPRGRVLTEWLEVACANDASLRQRVEALLAASVRTFRYEGGAPLGQGSFLARKAQGKR
jgi:hypothetical protein